MSGKQPEYWDANVLTAWLQDERRAKAEMDGIAERVREFDEQRIHIVSSVMTFIEIWESSLTPITIDLLEKLKLRPNFHAFNVTGRIAKTAHDLRRFYKEHEDGVGKTVSLVDSIHLATAIEFPCKSIYTFDGST